MFQTASVNQFVYWPYRVAQILVPAELILLAGDSARSVEWLTKEIEQGGAR